MGTRIVFKKNGITYIASDVSPQVNETNVNEYNTFIKVIHKDLIVAKRNHDLILDLMDINPQWFTQSVDEQIDKKFIVNKIVNPLIKLAIEKKYLDIKKMYMENSVYIITQDKMFQITSTFVVIEAHYFLSADSEEPYAFYHYHHDIEHMDIEDFLRKVFSTMHKRLTLVDKNFVVLNNQDYQYKWIRGQRV